MGSGVQCPVTTKPADMAFELVGHLETHFRADNIIDHREGKILDFAQRLQHHADHADQSLRLAQTVTRGAGARGPRFLRSVNELQRSGLHLIGEETEDDDAA